MLFSVLKPKQRAEPLSQNRHPDTEGKDVVLSWFLLFHSIWFDFHIYNHGNKERITIFYHFKMASVARCLFEFVVDLNRISRPAWGKTRKHAIPSRCKFDVRGGELEPNPADSQSQSQATTTVDKQLGALIFLLGIITWLQKRMQQHYRITEQYPFRKALVSLVYHVEALLILLSL